MEKNFAVEGLLREIWFGFDEIQHVKAEGLIVFEQI
jgi:hypothetical protein